MAQSGYTPILLYASGTTTNVPLAANLTSSASGAELALNYVDGKLFYKDNAGVVQTLATKSSTSGVFTSVTDSGLTSGRVTYATTGGLLTDSANLTFSGGALNITGGLNTTGAIIAGGAGLAGNTRLGTLGVDGTVSYIVAEFLSGTSGYGAFLHFGDGATYNKAFGTDTNGDFNWYTGRYTTSAGTSQMRLDSSGNLGLGVTPSAWGTSSAIDITAWSAIGTIPGNGSTVITNNAYYNSSGVPKYKISTFNAATYSQSTGGVHAWATAVTGTAGATITFTQAMTLDSSGNLGIGVTSPTSRLHVSNSLASTNAIAQFTNGTTGTGAGNGLYVGIDSTNTATIFNFYNSNLQFGTNGTTKMTLDTSGNLGLGVVPSAWSSGRTAIEINGSTQPAFAFNSTSSPNNGGVIVANAYYTSGTAWTYKSTGYATQYQQASGTHAWYTAPSGTAGNAITFTQAMTLDTSGNLLVGTTSRLNSSKLTVVTSVDNASTFQCASSGNYPVMCWNTSSSSCNFMIFQVSSGTGVGSITYNGSLTLYNTTSDQRLKSNIVDAPSGNIDDIKVRSFDWITNNNHQKYGMIAQELLEVAPYAVHQPEKPDEMMGVDYSKLVPMMIKEIQDLKARLTALESK